MSSKAAKEIQGVWQEISERVYSLVDRQRELGLGKKVRNREFRLPCHFVRLAVVASYYSLRGPVSYVVPYPGGIGPPCCEDVKVDDQTWN